MNIYTGWAILIALPNFLGIYTRYRKMFRTKVEGGINDLDRELGFQSNFEVKVIFSNRNLYFWRPIWIERKIWRIRCCIGQGRFKVILRSNRRKWVKFCWLKMWIFYRVLLRPNKFPKLGQLAKHERPWLFEGHELPIFCATPLFQIEPCIFFDDIITDFKTNSATYNTRSF